MQALEIIGSTTAVVALLIIIMDTFASPFLLWTSGVLVLSSSGTFPRVRLLVWFILRMYYFKICSVMLELRRYQVYRYPNLSLELGVVDSC